MTRFSLIAAAALLATAGTAFAETAGAPARLDDIRQFKSGQEVWEKTCSRCHTAIDDRQDQAVGPDLALNEYDVDSLTFFVRNGHLAMPAFPESAIDTASLNELAEYMAKNVYKGDAE